MNHLLTEARAARRHAQAMTRVLPAVRVRMGRRDRPAGLTQRVEQRERRRVWPHALSGEKQLLKLFKGRAERPPTILVFTSKPGRVRAQNLDRRDLCLWI